MQQSSSTKQKLPRPCQPYSTFLTYESFLEAARLYPSEQLLIPQPVFFSYLEKITTDMPFFSISKDNFERLKSPYKFVMWPVVKVAFNRGIEVKTILLAIFLFFFHLSANKSQQITFSLAFAYLFIAVKFHSLEVMKMEALLPLFSVDPGAFALFKREFVKLEGVILNDINFELKIPPFFELFELIRLLNRDEEPQTRLHFEELFFLSVAKNPDYLFCQQDGIFHSANGLYKLLKDKV